MPPECRVLGDVTPPGRSKSSGRCGAALGAERGGPGAGAGGGGVAAAPARRTELQNPTGFFSFFGLAFLVARLNLSPLTQSLSPVTTASGGLGVVRDQDGEMAIEVAVIKWSC